MDIGLKLKMSKQQEAYNAKRLNELKNHPLVIRFLHDNEVGLDVLEKNLSKFDRYVRYYENEKEMVEFRIEGYDLELSYQNDVVDFQYVVNEETSKQKNLTKHLDYYLINHLPQSFYLNNFETLDLADESPNYLNIVSKLIDLSVNPTKKGLFLYGNVGCGKSYLMACLANRFANDKKTVCFIKVNRLINDLKSSFNTYNDFKEKTMRKMMGCDLLILDDIGAENPSAWSRDEIVFTILDHRMENELLTCFTSNLDKDAIKNHYLQASGSTDPNKADRLMERFLVLSEFIELKSSHQSRRLTTTI